MARFEKGNTVSQIGDEKSAEYIHARCTVKQKRQWQKAAKKSSPNGRGNLSRWICNILDRASEQ